MSLILHLDPFAGVAGDMLLGLLVDLGVAPEQLAALPERLGLVDVEVRTARVQRGALAATKVDVVVRGQVEGPAPPGDRQEHAHGAGHGHAPTPAHGSAHEEEHDWAGPEVHAHHHLAPSRDLAAMLAVVERAALPPRVAARARHAIEALFAAEARVHGLALAEVHLHEAGGDDALVDIVGTCLGLELLGVRRVTCATPVPLGGGTVLCAHGRLPVPTPAVAELMRDVAVTGGPVARELVTPTGASLLRAIVDEFRPLPEMVLRQTGYGAGGYNGHDLPSVLRGLVGEDVGGPRERSVAVVETALDDMLPQDVPALVERLLATGARDAFVTPILMKKGRPGSLLTVICDPTDASALARLVLAESPTLGVRIHTERRLEWDRDHVIVATPWGPVRVKRALDPRGTALRGQPEYEDCRRAADTAGVPVDDVRRAAERSFETSHRNEGEE